MLIKQFYLRLKADLMDLTPEEHRHHITDMKITSLHQVLGMFRSVMIKNNKLIEENKFLNEELKTLANVLGIDR